MSTTIVRRQPRSKGCEQCIARRVKVRMTHSATSCAYIGQNTTWGNITVLTRLTQCDERPGCCKQCSRFGLSCSGAIRGAVFLDMTEKVSCNTVRPKKQRKKKTAPVEEQKKRTDKPSSTDVASEREGTVDDKRSLTDRPAASLAPLTDSTWENKGERQHTELLGIEEKGENTHFVDPSLPSTWPKVHINDDKCFRIMTSNYNSSIPPRLDAAAYNEYCFVGKFAQLIMSSRRSYSNNRPQSWILELPHLAAKKALPSSLRYAMHAAALLYHAVTTHDDRAKVAAIGWYLAAIHSYRTTILASTPRKAPVAPVPEVAVGSEGLSISEIAEICVPIMFSFYEGLQGSSSDAELLHHAAATEMLERRGPEKCASGLAHSVMRSLGVREVRKLRYVLIQRPWPGN